jgi:putative salt-induced outer membrane protein YdiY
MAMEAVVTATDGSEQAESAETPAAPVEPATTQPEAPPEPPKLWKFTFLLGGALTDGNTENASITSTFTALREDERNRTLFDAGYFFARSNDETSENRFTAGVRHDWLKPGEKVFYFGTARYDYDEFQSWDNRVQAHLGLGYRLLEPPKWKLNLLAGAGALKEFGSDDDDVRPEALFGLEGEWQIADKHTLTFASTIFPDLGDLGEYRWVSSAGWSYLMDEKNRLSLTAGVQYEYDSLVDPGNTHYDLRAFVGQQMDF